jgi:hypothetical protein
MDNLRTHDQTHHRHTTGHERTMNECTQPNSEVRDQHLIFGGSELKRYQNESENCSRHIHYLTLYF